MSAEEKLAARLEAATPGWLPIAGHVSTYTFTLAERELAINSLRRLAAQSDAAGDGPVAWMNREHVDAYAAGHSDGVAWASHKQSEFYTVPVYLAVPQAVPEILGELIKATEELAISMNQEMRVRAWDKIDSAQNRGRAALSGKPGCQAGEDVLKNSIDAEIRALGGKEA